MPIDPAQASAAAIRRRGLAGAAHGRLSVSSPARDRAAKVDEAEAVFVGKTRRGTAARIALPVSDRAADGSVALRFPGHPVVLRETWTFEETDAPHADGPRGGMPSGPGATLATLSLERVDGDGFGLSRKTEVPFVLPPERTTLADLRKRAGVI
ncbi:hypothetical protein [Methylobacterium sp. Leaf118]|uniref:hypothetical protein n=1 Tax=Methylobacterium sp. Leaf118 TaxID=2876562 RepID=UPI001E42E53E|nr:hypothetical protein [Methylobacterium sp. Leaf118]